MSSQKPGSEMPIPEGKIARLRHAVESALGHEPKVSLRANPVRTTSDNGHRLRPRRFLSRVINGHRGVLTGVKQTATNGRRSQYREQVSTSRGTPIEAIAHTSASRQKFWLGCVCAALSACRAFTHVARATGRDAEIG
jgi:hypothetical protein